MNNNTATIQSPDLGEHPFKGMVKFSLSLIVIGSVATALLFWWDPIIGALAGCAALVLGGFLGLAMIGFLIGGSGGWKHYKKARKLILDGTIEPSYIGKNGNWSTLMIVDENNSQVYLNGKIHRFNDIRGFQRKTKSTLHVFLKRGEVPVSAVTLDGEREAIIFYERLKNTLQFV